MDSHLGTWQRDWRRFGAGVMGGALVLGVGWFNVSRTFISAGPNGTLVHPSPLTLVFWLLLAGAALGLWIYLSTYIDLPWFGKLAAKELDRVQRDESIEYALTCTGFHDFDVQVWGKKGFRLINLQAEIYNGSGEVIEYEFLDDSVTFESYQNEAAVIGLKKSRILPNRSFSYMLPVVHVPLDREQFAGGDEYSGEIEFRIKYRHIKGSRTRLSHYKVTYSITVRDDGAINLYWYFLIDDDDWDDAVAVAAGVAA